MSKITVLLAEDHAIVRKGLCSLLENSDDIEVLGEAENGREAVRMSEKTAPDVVVMDISMPELNGLEATRRIHQRCPKTRVLVLTMHEREEYVLEILRAGGAGYVIKKAVPDELVQAIRAVKNGEAYLSPAISQKVIDDYLRRTDTAEAEDPYEKLTSREKEILQLVAEGNSNKEMATKLHISVNTVTTHRRSLMSKLDLHNVADVTRFAVKKGLVAADGG